MNYVITELNHLNEPVMFSNSTLSDYLFDTFFGEFKAETCDEVESYAQSKVLHCT